MKYILLAVCCILARVMVMAQNPKIVSDPHAQKRSVQGFHGISIASGIDLYLNQGGDEAVAVSAADPEFRDKIVTEVENGVLHIYIENKGFHWNWGGNRKLKAYVSCNLLDELRASGGSDVFIDGSIRSDKLTMNLSGGSDLHGKLVVGDLSIGQSGGADVYLSGSAGQLHVHVSGGSDFHGYDFAVDDCHAEASGGSDVYVTVNKELDAEASGGSDIHYKGTGSVHESHSSGSGSISRSH